MYKYLLDFCTSFNLNPVNFVKVCLYFQTSIRVSLPDLFCTSFYLTSVQALLPDLFCTILYLTSAKASLPDLFCTSLYT